MAKSLSSMTCTPQTVWIRFSIGALSQQEPASHLPLSNRCPGCLEIRATGAAVLPQRQNPRCFRKKGVLDRHGAPRCCRSAHKGRNPRGKHPPNLRVYRAPSRTRGPLPRHGRLGRRPRLARTPILRKDLASGRIRENHVRDRLVVSLNRTSAENRLSPRFPLPSHSPAHPTTFRSKSTPTPGLLPLAVCPSGAFSPTLMNQSPHVWRPAHTHPI